jgi:hypothetical protein
MKELLFDFLGNKPDRWRSVGEALAHNAGILARHRQEHVEDREQLQEALGIYIYPTDMAFASLILWGYALECFFKCLYLEERGQLAKNGRYVGPKTHNLVQIAGDLGFSLSDNQRRVLTDLSIITTWSGRYPVGTEWEKTFISHRWQTPEDDKIVEALVKDLRMRIEQ